MVQKTTNKFLTVAACTFWGVGNWAVRKAVITSNLFKFNLVDMRNFF